MPEMTSRAFSFNSPHGACPDCQGLGATYDFDPRLIVPDESKSLLGGAISPWARGDRKLVREAILTLAQMFGIDPDTPFSKLPKKHRDLLLTGPPAAAAKAAKAAKASAAAAAVPIEDDDDGDEEFELPPTRRRRPRDGELDPFGKDFEGVIPNLRRRYEEGSWVVQEDLGAVPDVAAVPDVRRAPPQAAEPGGPGQEPRHSGIRQPADQRGARGVREVRAERARIADRLARPARDPGTAPIPARGRGRVSHAESQRGDAVGRRGAAYPPGHADWREPLGRALRAGRAIDRVAPARQSQAAVDAVAPARPWQHGRRRRARRGDDPHGRLRGRPRAWRRRTRRSRHFPGAARGTA